MHVVKLLNLDPNGIDYLRVLMRADRQRAAKVVKPKFHGFFCNRIKAIVKTGTTPFAAFRFFFKTSYGFKVFLRPIWCGNKLNVIACFFVEIVNKFLLDVFSSLILGTRMNVRVGIIDGYFSKFSHALQRRRAARSTAGMEQNLRPNPRCLPILNHFHHDLVIIDFLVQIHFLKYFLKINQFKFFLSSFLDWMQLFLSKKLRFAT